MNKNELLALALEKEKNSLPEFNAFDEPNNLEDYDAAINYLRTGAKPYGYENNELLVDIIEDFDTICSDYGI